MPITALIGREFRLRTAKAVWNSITAVVHFVATRHLSDVSHPIPMENKLPVRVRFGAFELDLRSGELRLAAVAGEAAESGIVLPKQPFCLLHMLVEREGAMVTREEVRKKFWPNDTIVEFDHSINVAIADCAKHWVTRPTIRST